MQQFFELALSRAEGRSMPSGVVYFGAASKTIRPTKEEK